jgi:hypothetical protein
MINIFFLLLLNLQFKATITQDPCSGGYPCDIGGFPKALTPGNFLAIRVGSSNGPDMRNRINSESIIGPTFMDEINMMGILVQTIDLGSLAVPIRLSLFTGGTGPSEGLISTSFNGRYVIFGGYNMPIGWSVLTGPYPLGGSLPTINENAQYRQSTWPNGWNYPPRIVARVGVDGRISIIAQDYNAMQGDTIRGTCSYDGESAYMLGHAMMLYNNDGTAIPDPFTKTSPVMYYAGNGASGVPILENTFSSALDLFGTSRGCLISDALSPGTPKLYVTTHTRHYFQWDKGSTNSFYPTRCSCNSTNPPKVECRHANYPWYACQAVGSDSTNIDRGVFEISTIDGKLPLGTNKADYRGLAGISADSRDQSRETILTSVANYERFGNFHFTDAKTMFVPDASYNAGSNWYNAQSSRPGANNMLYAPGIHKYVMNSTGYWKFTPRVGYSTSGETITGGVIDGGVDGFAVEPGGSPR